MSTFTPLKQVYLSGIDISNYVADFSVIPQQVGEYGQVTINSLQSLTGINQDGFWDSLNPASPFYGVVNLNAFELVVTLEGVTIFSGEIISIVADNQTRTADVIVRDALQQKMEHGCEYASEAPESPALAIANICDLYLIPFDNASFGRANALYSADSVVVSCYLLRPDLTTIEVIQMLCELGCARVWSQEGTLYIDVYRDDRDVSPVVIIQDDVATYRTATLWQAPMVTPIEKEKTTGYAITWVGGETTFGPDSASRKSINGGNDQPIRVQTLQSAIWIGEKWLSYLSAPQKRVEVVTDAQIGRALALLYPIEIEYTRGNWANIIADTVVIDNSDKLVSRIVALTR